MSIVDRAREAAEELGEKAKGLAKGLGGKVSDAAGPAWDKVRGAADTVGDKVSDVAGPAWGKAKDAAETVGDKVSGVAGDLKDKVFGGHPEARTTADPATTPTTDTTGHFSDTAAAGA